MTRGAFIAAAALALAPASALAVGHDEHVRLVALSPAVVRGTGFDARERVTVTVRSPDTKMQARATSTASGAFTVSFERGLPVRACQGFSVTAVGAHGDRATWKSPPRVCGTQLAP